MKDNVRTKSECIRTLMLAVAMVLAAVIMPFMPGSMVAQAATTTCDESCTNEISEAEALIGVFGTLADGRYTLTSQTYTLTDDVNTAGYIYVPEGVTATIDLNGHTIDRGLTSEVVEGSVIIVDGTLTIKDSGTGGKVQGGYAADEGSCVRVQAGATFTLQSGTLIGRDEEYDYTVGVDYGSTFNMSGGKITNGWGGVFANGTGTMSGGEISGNSFSGVRLVTNDFSVLGNPVITGNGDSNVSFWDDSYVMKIQGALTEGANIGIYPGGKPTDNSTVTLTSGYGTYNTVAPDTYFSLDNGGVFVFSREKATQTELDRDQTSGEVIVKKTGEVNIHWVCFYLNDQDFYNFQKFVIENGSLSEPAEPTDDGYAFDGWFEDPNFWWKYNFDSVVCRDINLYAKWKKLMTNTDITVESILHKNYTGNAIEPDVVVKDGDTMLVKDTDYTVSYSDNTAVGTAKAIITGIGNYSGTVEKTFTINAKALTVANVSDLSAQTYTGSAIEPEVTVNDGETRLALATDYTVSYSDNTNAGTAKAIITGIGNYSGTVEKTFTINAKALTVANVSDLSAQTYTGSAIEPEVTVNDGETRLALGTDYTVSYSDNTNAGTAKAIITGIGNYSGTVEKTFTISKAEAKTLDEVSVSRVYTQTEVSASVSKTMPEDAGSLTYAKGTESKTGSVTVSNWNVDSSGNVTATLSGGEVGDTITLPVTIGSTNYEDSTVNVVITLTAKDDAGVSIEGIPQTDIVKIEYDDTFASSGLLKNPGTNGTWTWTSSNTEVLQITSEGENAVINALKAGSATITASYESDTTIGTYTTELITVHKATTAVTAPTAKTLTYNGKEQELVTAGSSTFGTVLYSLDGKTYSESIPKAVNAGEYKVYYKVDGTDNWNAVEAASVNVTIKKATPAPKEEGAKLTVSDTKAEYVVTSKAGEEPTVEYKPAADAKEKTVTVPESVTVDGVAYKVTKVTNDAFKNNKTVETVVVPKSVTEIGDNAFSGCTGLKSVTIPASVTEIGDNAFVGCTSLKSVKIPDNVTRIGTNAFKGCKKLKSATLGKNVTEIGNSAFANCTSLTKVTISANVTKLGSNIFKGCKNLKTITIKTTKLTSKNIAKNAFKGVGNKVTIKVPKKMKKAYTKLFRKKGLSKKVKIK